MSKETKYIVAATGETIRGYIIAHGLIKDSSTGATYLVTDLKVANSRNSILSKIIHYKRIGVSMYAREYWKYKTFFLCPTMSVECVSGYDRFVDFEIKFLCFGIGIRFIWIKKH